MKAGEVKWPLAVMDRKGMLSSSISTRKLIRELPQGRHLKGRVILDLVRNRYVPYRPDILDDPELDARIASEALSMVVSVGRVQLCHPMTVLRVRQFKARPIIAAQEMGMADLPRITLSRQFPPEARFKGYCVLNHAISLDGRTGLNSYESLLKQSWRDRSAGRMQDYLRLIDQLWRCTSVENKGIGFLMKMDFWLKGHGQDEVKKVREPKAAS